MTYDAQAGALTAQPMELYRFTCGASVWGYTSADRDIIYNGTAYKAVAISNAGPTQGGETSAEQLKITLESSLQVPQLFRETPPGQTVTLQIFGQHVGDAETVVLWTGEVRSAKFTGLGACELVCSPLTERLEKQGLRLGWERTCPHALYSAPCGVSQERYRLEVTVHSIEGNSVTVIPAPLSEYDYVGGLIAWQAGDWTERRAIESQNGSTLGLLDGTARLYAGARAVIYPGCRQTVAACQAYENLPNYGGIPHLCGDNPFEKNIF